MPVVEAVAPMRGVTTGAMALILSRSSILSSHLTTARVTVSFSRLFAKKPEKIMANPKVFFDVAINNQNIGRLVMEVTITSCLSLLERSPFSLKIVCICAYRLFDSLVFGVVQHDGI